MTLAIICSIIQYNMHPVKNALPLSNPPLAHEIRAGIATAPVENRVIRAANSMRELFHTKFEAWVSTTEDTSPNVRIHHLPAAVLPPTTLSMLARREARSQQIRDDSRI